MDKEVQILIDDNRIIRVFCEPADLFAVINGLILQDYTPQIRLFDDELNDWTCWQHTTQEKAA